MSRRTAVLKPILSALLFAGVVLALTWGLRQLDVSAFTGPEGKRRSLQIVIGLGLAFWANTMPKQIGRAVRSPYAEGRTQTALRVGGWAFALAGLAYAALWAFAPLPVADLWGMAVVAGALLLTLGYAAWCFTTARRGGAAAG